MIGVLSIGIVDTPVNRVAVGLRTRESYRVSQVMFLVFNTLGLLFAVAGLLIGFGLDRAGLLGTVAVAIGATFVFVADVWYRLKNEVELRWKRFFYPSTGGQWFFIPCWCWMIVMLFIGVIFPFFESPESKAAREIRDLDHSFKKFLDEGGEFPRKKGDRVMKGEPDPWGNLYNWEYPSRRFPDNSRPAIWSSGPNGKNEHGEGDDIGNW